MAALGHDVGFDQRWRFGQGHHAVAVEVALLHGTVFDVDLAVKGGGEAVDHRAFDLRFDDVGVHHRMGVYDADHALDRQGAVGDDRNLHHLGDDRAEGFQEGDAAGTESLAWLFQCVGGWTGAQLEAVFTSYLETHPQSMQYRSPGLLVSAAGNQCADVGEELSPRRTLGQRIRARN